MSGRFVAAMRMMLSFISKPSISTRSWFRVCSRSSWPPPRPAPRWRPTASISSMKMMHGAACLACSKRSRTRLAPTPTNISTKSEPEIEKNGTPASPATARASSVLPVPGWPNSSTPLGILAPSAWYRAGFCRKSLISCNSSIASSAPATSANVVFGVSLLTSLALLRPKLMTRLPPPCTWLMTKNRTPTMSRIGSRVGRADLAVILERRLQVESERLLLVVHHRLGHVARVDLGNRVRRADRVVVAAPGQRRQHEDGKDDDHDGPKPPRPVETLTIHVSSRDGGPSRAPPARCDEFPREFTYGRYTARLGHGAATRTAAHSQPTAAGGDNPAPMSSSRTYAEPPTFRASGAVRPGRTEPLSPFSQPPYTD